MQNNCKVHKKDPSASRRYGCLVFLLICLLVVLLIYITYYIYARLSESTLFLETENIILVKTYDLHVIQNDPRVVCFLEEVNRTTVNPHYYRDKMILKESDVFLVFTGERRVRSCFIRIDVDPYTRFQDKCRFTFYRIHKDVLQNKPFDIKTEYLGSIETNLYGAWRQSYGRFRISLSPDGKYIVMSAHAVNSRVHGKFRNKDVLLIWEIGENVVEKDIVDSRGNKIPILFESEVGLEEKDIKPPRHALLKEKPDNLKNMKATSLSRTSIKLTWEQARNADGYRIYQMNNTNNIRWSRIATDISPCEYTVTGLLPNTTYRFMIEPVNSKTGAVSMWDRTIEATTPP